MLRVRLRGTAVCLLYCGALQDRENPTPTTSSYFWADTEPAAPKATDGLSVARHEPGTAAALGSASVSLPKTQRLPVGARPGQPCPRTQAPAPTHTHRTRAPGVRVFSSCRSASRHVAGFAPGTQLVSRRNYRGSAPVPAVSTSWPRGRGSNPRDFSMANGWSRTRRIAEVCARLLLPTCPGTGIIYELG